MSIVSEIFDHRAAFDPSAPTAEFDAFLKQVPARWVVYLFVDVDDQPVQLLCVKNLRASLKRRLGGEEIVGPTRRVNYRELVRGVYWQRVDSAFEADVVYYEAARQLFPSTYRGMVGFRPAWFAHINPDAPFPRYTKTTDLSRQTGTLIGPLEDKHAAARLIELAEDAFDLCRYYNILVESPSARACAYKEMGKCPAPCDGSISMDQYRRLVELSVSALVDPADYIRDQKRRMEQAAAELRFETAGKIKSYIDALSQLGKGAFRHARKLSDFAYLSLQRGPTARSAKVFLITPGRIEPIAALVEEPAAHPSDVLRIAFDLAAGHASAATGVDEIAAERIGVVAHHLFSARQTHGVFVPLDELDEKALLRAYRDLQKQKPADGDAPSEIETEGVLKELQAM